MEQESLGIQLKDYSAIEDSCVKMAPTIMKATPVVYAAQVNSSRIISLIFTLVIIMKVTLADLHIFFYRPTCGNSLHKIK